MSQSAADLEFTTNAIIANHERTIRDLRALLFTIGDILDEATVIDRRTEARLGLSRHFIDVQRDLAERSEAAS